jgi:hypothetical protein
MADTQRHRTIVNSARRKYSAKQIAAGFGGARRKAAAKTARKSARKNKSGHRPKAKANRSHRPRSKPKTAQRKNYGNIISYTLPKESGMAATKANPRSKKKASSHHRRATKKNTGHRRRTHRNPSMGDLTGLVTSAVFTVAGAVGSKYITQMVLTTSNTGIMGYLGNIVSAFLLSWGVKAFMKNDRAAGAVLAGGFVQVVLRLIADYTPFGQYTSNLGMGDYLAQSFLVPQRIAYSPHSAQLIPAGQMGLSGCNSLYTTNSGLYAA